MTREEALERLEDYFEYEDGLSADKDTREAYRMALEALKAEPTLSEIAQCCEKRGLVLVESAIFEKIKSDYCHYAAKMNEVEK